MFFVIIAINHLYVTRNWKRSYMYKCAIWKYMSNIFTDIQCINLSENKDIVENTNVQTTPAIHIRTDRILYFHSLKNNWAVHKIILEIILYNFVQRCVFVLLIIFIFKLYFNQLKCQTIYFTCISISSTRLYTFNVQHYLNITKINKYVLFLQKIYI